MRRSARKGYTLMEMLVILAVLIILGAVIVPTLSSNYGNTRQKSAADLIRARISEARAKAMEQGTWYRLAVHEDKSRIRLAPDGPDFDSLPVDDPPAPDSKVTEDKLDTATAELIIESGDPRTPDSGQWITIMTVGPEGICREDNTTVSVKEKDFQPILIQVRGVIGSSRVVPAPTSGGKK